MSKTTPVRDAGARSDAGETPLKDPVLAATLAWLIPGLGHWYQGRRSKALLFFVCILGTFVFGLYLGEGRVVYASMRPGDNRFPYFCQVAVGLPALPALVQSYRVNHGSAPANFGLWKDFMVPPGLTKGGQDIPSELDQLHKKLNRFFELGTVYTMVAGLLNVLAIYDAFAGPAEGDPSTKKEGGEATGPPLASS